MNSLLRTLTRFLLLLMAGAASAQNVHFTRSYQVWDGEESPYYIALELTGDVSSVLVVDVLRTHFDLSPEVGTVTFAAGEALAAIEITRDRVGPFGGSRRTVFELIPGPGYIVGGPEFCEVEIIPDVPHTPVKGKYFGLLDGPTFDHLALGTIQVATTVAGSYTVSLKIAGRTLAMKGQVDARGRISRTINLPQLGRKLVDLRIDPYFPAITGTIGDVNVYAARQLSEAQAVTAGLTGKRLVLAWFPDLTGPQGAAHAIARIGTAGTVTVAGLLPDGKPFSCGTRFAVDSTLPIFASLYQAKGLFHSYFTPRAGFAGTWASRGKWAKPATGAGELGAAINQSTVGFMEFFLPPLVDAPLSEGFEDTAGKGVLTVGLPVGVTLTLPFDLGSETTAAFIGGEMFAPQLTINRKNGLFTGSVRVTPQGAVQAVRGVFLPTLLESELAGQGAGLLIQGATSHPVRILPRL